MMFNWREWFKKEKIEKGYFNGDPEAGFHAHTLVRNHLSTQFDGAHLHLFQLPSGEFLITEEDGYHKHSMDSEFEDFSTSGTSAHKHKLIIQNDITLEAGQELRAGDEIYTEEDGEHDHSLMVETTGFDGAHQHKLILADGSVIESLSAGQFYEINPMDQTDLPPIPKASEFIKVISQALAADVFFSGSEPPAQLEENRDEHHEEEMSKELATKAEGFVNIDAISLDTTELGFWASQRFPVAIRPIHKATLAVISVEPGLIKTSASLPESVKETLSKSEESFSIEAEVFKDKIIVTDALRFKGDDIRDKDFIDRYEAVQNLFKGEFSGNDSIQKAEYEWINTSLLLQQVAKNITSNNFGAVIKPRIGLYGRNGKTTDSLNVFKTIRLKAKVADKIDQADGFIYKVALENEENELFEIGKTINSPIEGSIGDIITIDATISGSENELNFDRMTVVSFDEARKSTFTKSEVIELAKQGRILKEELPASFQMVAAALGIKLTKKEKPEFELIPIAKVDQDQQIVYGAVLEEETVDTQNDIISAEEIEKAAHRYMKEARVIGFRHFKKADADLVESVVLRPGDKFNGQEVEKTTWVIGVHVRNQNLWKSIRSGDIKSFSIGALGLRKPIS